MDVHVSKKLIGRPYSKKEIAMMDDSKKIQTRREFFKKTAKKTLPIVAAIALSGMPGIVKATEKAPTGCNSYDCQNGCRFACTRVCNSSCKGSCQNDCYSSCYRGCNNTCENRCDNSCQGYCTSTCRGGCYGSNR